MKDESTNICKISSSHDKMSSSRVKIMNEKKNEDVKRKKKKKNEDAKRKKKKKSEDTKRKKKKKNEGAKIKNDEMRCNSKRDSKFSSGRSSSSYKMRSKFFGTVRAVSQEFVKVELY